LVKTIRVCEAKRIIIISPTKKADKAVETQRISTPGYANSNKGTVFLLIALKVKYQNWQTPIAV
jgi:hypothetical protein